MCYHLRASAPAGGPSLAEAVTDDDIDIGLLGFGRKFDSLDDGHLTSGEIIPPSTKLQAQQLFDMDKLKKEKIFFKEGKSSFTKQIIAKSLEEWASKVGGELNSQTNFGISKIASIEGFAAAAFNH